MKSCTKTLCALFLALGLAHTHSFAQTDGSARMAVTIKDYTGTSNTKHWTVAWVTTGSGTFIKSLRKQGPSITSTHWNSHCSTWWSAKSGSTSLDGYSSATAQDYAGTNSPVILTWNCRDAANNLVADGDYKFWVQYAEDSGQGPYTTSGLLWTKGTGGITNNYANQGANFTSMQVSWLPSTTATVAPTITSVTPPATGTVGVPYNFTVTATGTAPITFTAPGLPTGLAISGAGIISGTPTSAGTFAGTITAANGTLPNATQSFSIVTALVPTDFAALQLNGNDLVMSGNGPANGIYAVLVSTTADALSAQWTAIATNSFDNAGEFSFTNAVSPGVPRKFYRLRVP
jgi:hypothetical protein